MELIRQPNNWSCQPASYAMCMDRRLDEVLEVLGHDGSRIENFEATTVIWTVACFHPAELVLAAYKFGYAVVDIPAAIISHNGKAVSNYPRSVNALVSRFPEGTRFVLTVLSERYQDGYHCVAYERGEPRYYDPQHDRPRKLLYMPPVKMVAAILKIGVEDERRLLPDKYITQDG